MFEHNLVCPKCGHQFLAKLGHHDAEVIHVTAPGTSFACPKCGATFSLAEALSKIEITNTSKNVYFLICVTILSAAAMWLILQ